MVEGGDSRGIDLAKGDLECEACKSYHDYVVRSSLSRVSNKAMKSNTFECEEKLLSFLCRYIKSPLNPWILNKGNFGQIRRFAKFSGYIFMCVIGPVIQF